MQGVICINGTKIRNIVYSALFAAIICIATVIVRIPVPATKGYINLGDCFVIISGAVLGPLYGFLASALGSALSDIINGAAYFVPATFIIKGVMALAVSLIYGKTGRKKFSLLLSGIIAEIIMTAGYLVYEAFVLGYKSAAVAELPMNAIQGAAGIILSFILLTAISKNTKLREIFLTGGNGNEHI